MKKRRSYRIFFYIISPIILILLNKIFGVYKALAAYFVLLLIIHVFLQKVFGAKFMSGARAYRRSRDNSEFWRVDRGDEFDRGDGFDGGDGDD